MKTINPLIIKANLAGVLMLSLAGCVTRTVYVTQTPAPPAPPPATVVVAPEPEVVTPPAPSVLVIRTESDFYEPLSAHGEWIVTAAFGRCWRPARVDASWRPYANGYWQRTDAGWYWASDEPWGWATYHYGRWDWTTRYGWIWVPQTQWAPAWVTWREGAGYIGWAPLPPAATFNASGSIEVNGVFSPRFVFVEERRLLEPVRPRTVIVNNTTIINKTVNISRTTVVNKTVINEGPRTEVIEHATGRKLKPVAVHDLRRKEEEPTVTRHRNLFSRPEDKTVTPKGPVVENPPLPPIVVVDEPKEPKEKKPDVVKVHPEHPEHPVHPEHPEHPEHPVHPVHPDGEAYSKNVVVAPVVVTPAVVANEAKPDRKPVVVVDENKHGNPVASMKEPGPAGHKISDADGEKPGHSNRPDKKGDAEPVVVAPAVVTPEAKPELKPVVVVDDKKPAGNPVASVKEPAPAGRKVSDAEDQKPGHSNRPEIKVKAVEPVVAAPAVVKPEAKPDRKPVVVADENKPANKAVSSNRPDKKADAEPVVAAPAIVKPEARTEPKPVRIETPQKPAPAAKPEKAIDKQPKSVQAQPLQVQAKTLPVKTSASVSTNAPASSHQQQSKPAKQEKTNKSH